MSKKILIVEDEESYQKALSAKLENAGYEVYNAKSGDEGINLLEEGIDLILLDLLMPKSGGWDFMSKLMKTDHNSTPIIILTNLEKSGFPDTPIVVLDYLIKTDVSLDDIVEKIDKALSVKKI